MMAMKARENREDLVARLPWLKAAVILLLVVVGGAYWSAQLVHGAHYRQLAEHNRLRKIPVKAPRGAIHDRQGRPLVENIPSYDLLLDRSRSAGFEASLAFAAGILERPVEELAAALRRYESASPFLPLLVAKGLTLEQVTRFGVASLEHPEFEIQAGHLRLYRHGPQTAHAVGHLGEASPEDLARPDGSDRPGDLVGRRGVEQAFDGVLRGVDGEDVVVVDSQGRPREEFGRREAVPGRSLELTLDLELQQAAARYLEDKVGAAVALDPRTGEILVLASGPSYDPNLFARRLDPGEWRDLLANPHHPLQNRAIQNTYSPGSIFKIVMAVAGLSEGVVSEHDTVFCGGSAVHYNRRFRCWKRGGHGTVDLRRAIVGSCDVYFYQLAHRLGIGRIGRYARLFGLGEATGLDITGEKRGLVPDPDWSLRARGTPWYAGETISVGIGQGPLLVTPLQIASMMAIVANGGYRVVPHLAQTSRVPPPPPLPLDRSAVEMVREALWAVVNEGGTGATARVPGIDIAGKTGTVQVVEQKTWIRSEELPFEHRDHAWFASFAKVEGTDLVVVVFVEHGGRGSRVAAPLAKTIYETYYAAFLEPRQERSKPS